MLTFCIIFFFTRLMLFIDYRSINYIIKGELGESDQIVNSFEDITYKELK